MFYTGCAIWGYKEWVGDLFPLGSKSSDFLSLYSQRLTSVEGNTTFYAIPKPDVVARWAEETPETFKFCLKIPRDISHQGPLAQQIGATHAFLERMAPLGPRLGPYFLQLPPSYRANQMRDLEQWIAEWPRQYQLSVEFRHDDWYQAKPEAELIDMLASYDVGRVVMDVRPIQKPPFPGDSADIPSLREKKPPVPMHAIRTNKTSLVRYIGHPHADYNDELLDEWAERVAQWLREGTEVYFFLHCPVEERSPALCRNFYQRLSRRIDLPALPWDLQNQGFTQISMF
jgi:uncharacterized protein YecE (DUF72 family)